MLSQKSKNIFIWCYLLVNWYLRKILILRTIISASESYWVLFVKRVGGAALYNNNGVWIVKKKNNLAEFCQHTHQCGSGLKEKLLPPPATEMAFLVRCYANCLQPWASKVSNYYFFCWYSLIIKFKLYLNSKWVLLCYFLNYKNKNYKAIYKALIHCHFRESLIQPLRWTEKTHFNSLHT